MKDGQVAVACMGPADGRIPPELAGAWLVWYDPEGNAGSGDAAWSHDPADAARFTPQEWAVLYEAVPGNRPVRPDGKPNRPITMFTLMIVPVSPGKLPSILPEVGGSPPMTDAEFMAELARMAGARAAPEDRPDAGTMDRRVMIMCDVRASGITGEVDDSYFVRVERTASGGVTVLWSDLPEQAMVFDDAAAAEEFCRDSPLEMFVVSFVPVSGSPSPALTPPPRQVESEADFRARLDRIVAEAGDPRRAPAPPPEPTPPPPRRRETPAEPELSKPGALSESLRKMGLM